MALRFNYFDKKVHELEEGDELLRHHPVCEVCHKEFDDVHELSKHVNQELRSQGR
jgi:hypothetical protein